MDSNYQTNVTAVLSFLQQNGYSDHSVYCYSRTYEHIDNYIQEQHLTYTPELGLSLMRDHCEDIVHTNNSPILCTAIRKLNAVYLTGSVINVILSPHKSYSSAPLCPSLSTLATDFFITIEPKFTEKQFNNAKRRVILFLKYLQSQRILKPEGISYQIVFQYHSIELAHLTPNSLMVEESTIHQFLHFLAEKGIVKTGLWVYLYQLEINQFVGLNNFTAEERLEFNNQAEQVSVTPDHLLVKGEELINLSLAEGYGEYVIESFSRTLYHLYTFFDYHGISYTVKSADIWLKSNKVKSVFKGSSWTTARRFLLLLGRLIETGEPEFSKGQQRIISGLSSLPAWCKEPLDSYCIQLKNEKLTKATIDNSVYSILRWYRFLLETGHSSFNEIIPQDIVNFNLQDIHKNAVGKNSCNSRIRRYLNFLHREGYIANANLGLLLGYTAGTRKQLITILTDEEINTIKGYISSAVTPLQIRNSAILLLGTEMGIRGCDIVGLQLKDIDWKNQCIRFCQDKTDVDAWLAMPTSVGNAIYRYIKEARPKQTKSSKLFVTANAPYKAITRKVCNPILKRALPERKVPGSGFHVTRKTFSTFRLRSGVSPEMIAGAMGHRQVESLTPYLYLDDDRMKQCALSVADLGISPEVIGHE